MNGGGGARDKTYIGHFVCLSQRVNLSSSQDVRQAEGGGERGGRGVVGCLVVSSCLGVEPYHVQNLDVWGGI